MVLSLCLWMVSVLCWFVFGLVLVVVSLCYLCGFILSMLVIFCFRYWICRDRYFLNWFKVIVLFWVYWCGILFRLRCFVESFCKCSWFCFSCVCCLGWINWVECKVVRRVLFCLVSCFLGLV